MLKGASAKELRQCIIHNCRNGADIMSAVRVLALIEIAVCEVIAPSVCVWNPLRNGTSGSEYSEPPSDRSSGGGHYLIVSSASVSSM